MDQGRDWSAYRGGLEPDDLVFVVDDDLAAFAVDDEQAPPCDGKDLRQHVVGVLRNLGVDEATLYALEVTGMLVVEENRHSVPPEHLAVWQAAVDEYHRRQAPIGER